MTDHAGCSEDDLINITFEFCNTKETGAVPASVFIKYLEEVTGHSHENSKLLLLYNMLDPERHNVLIDRETFHATMKKWIALCCQDCNLETEADKSKNPTNGALNYSDMLSFLSDENAEIFEGRHEETEKSVSKAFDLNSSVEDLKYMNQKITEQLLGIQKVVEMSEENCLQLTDEVVELRGRLTSMQKPVGNIKYIHNELEETKSKMANLCEENHVICGSVTNLKNQVEFLATKLISLEKNSTAHEEREMSLCDAFLLPCSQEHFKDILQEIKYEKNSIFQALMEEIELKQKMGHSLVIVVQILANVFPFMEMWNKVLKRLEMFLDSQLLAKTTCFNNAEFQKTEELSETNEHSGQSLLEAKIHDSSQSDQCLFRKTKISVPEDHTGVNLNKRTLKTVDCVSNNQMIPNSWKKFLEARKKWGSPEGRREFILETARSVAKNNVVDEKKESKKFISGHKIQPDQKKGKACTTTKQKETVLNILRELDDSMLEGDATNLQFIKALQFWISEGEGHFLTQEFSKEEKHNFQIENKIPNSTQSAELMNCNNFNCSNEHPSRVNLENCYSVAQQCSVHQNYVATNDEKYFMQEELEFDMKNEILSKEDSACYESAPLLPLYFPFLTYGPTSSCDNDNCRLQTSLIEALNLEYTWIQKRCWTFPNLFFVGQKQRSKKHLLNKKRHAYKTEHGKNNKRRPEVSGHPVNTEDGVKHLRSKRLPKYSVVTQRSLDQKSPQCLSSEVNLKQTFSGVHGCFSPHWNSACPSPPVMPTLPEDVGQPSETQHSNSSSPVKESPAEAETCSTPHLILPENTVLPDAERGTNLAFRSISPRRTNRHTKTSASSLTSVDNAGHVIDLLNDQLPDVKISDEDKKKNLELLEEAKRVSERFLTRRGRKSRSSLSESPTGLSPTHSPSVSPETSRSNSFTLPSPTGSDACTSTVSSEFPLQNATKGLTGQKQNDQKNISQGRLAPHTTSFENSKETLSKQEENFAPHKFMDNLSRSCTSGSESDRVSFNGRTDIYENELEKQFPKQNNFPLKGHLRGLGITLDPKSKSSELLPKDSRVSCKTELNTFGTRPPLLRAVSWDNGEPYNTEKAPFKPRLEDSKNFAISKSTNIATKSSAFKDLQIQVQPIRMQKLTKLREEHKLMRNQNLVGLKLPDLSEAAEQERGMLYKKTTSSSGSSPVPFSLEEEEEEETAVKSRSDVMPNISDALLRKLHVQTSIPGSSPPLTEKEVENVFVQLSLAFRNDSYTLESRINQAERERNLAEENTEKELDNFKVAITSSASLWHHSEHRDMYQKLLEDIAVLHRLSSRLSSQAEMVGAVRQEKRMSKATEVMMQYVENLKRTYEKDHAELMEYKKLANQNSSRSYGSPEDGVPRTSRSMSLSVGKMPRRRVSVAVVSKFELPGQPPSTLSVPLMSSLSESSNGRSNLTSSPVLPALIENGKSNGDPDCEPPQSVPVQSSLDEINPETKAKIEEEAYNKGYQEGLKKTKELVELKEDDEEKVDESPNEYEASESDNEIIKERSKLEVVIHYIQILYPKLHKHWNVFWIVAAIVIIFAVVLGISSLYNYFFSCTELSDGPHMKATCSAVQQYSWWSSGLQRDQRTE